MSYIRGVTREQVHLLPPSVEEYVEENAPVRAIDAFVDSLDMEKLELARPSAVTGRPAYDPADLLRLFIYGYLYRVRSSRRLEAETLRNLEVIWLLGGLRPDHWTIAAFRRENASKFKAVLRDFNLLCRQLELFGAELVAIDGAKFKAVNSPRRHYSAQQLQELKAHVEERIEAHLKQMDTADTEQEGVPERPTKQQLAEKLVQLRDRKARYEGLAAELAASGNSEMSLTDPDSRAQKKVGVGYNVQVAVDGKHDLIVTAEVVNDQNDLKQLHPIGQAAKEALAVTQLQVVADAGYHSADQLEQCEQANLETYVPAKGTTAGQAPGGQQVWPKTDFTYDAEQNRYRCPAGQTLTLRYSGQNKGTLCHYYYDIAACSACAMRGRCTTAKYRKITRADNEAVVERQAKRVAANPTLVAERKTIVEHVFGTLRQWGHDEFLCRGLERVRAEFTLSVLAYNLRRALNLIGVTELIAALRVG